MIMVDESCNKITKWEIANNRSLAAEHVANEGKYPKDIFMKISEKYKEKATKLKEIDLEDLKKVSKAIETDLNKEVSICYSCGQKIENESKDKIQSSLNNYKQKEVILNEEILKSRKDIEALKNESLVELLERIEVEKEMKTPTTKINNDPYVLKVTNRGSDMDASNVMNEGGM